MAEQRMSAKLTTLARKRGRLPALITAALIAALILAQAVLSSLAAWLGSGFYQRVSFGAVAFDDFTPWQPYFVESFVSVTLPYALGVFLSLWLIAPLAGELSVRFVIMRGLLASAVGSVLVLIVAIGTGFVTMIGFGFDIRGFAHSVIVAIGTAVNLFIYTTPVVVLAAVLLWLWLREHPREYEVSGLIDEL